MDRDKYDYHLAEELTKEADRLIREAKDKLHAASALYSIDTGSRSKQKRDILDKSYTALRLVQNDLFTGGCT